MKAGTEYKYREGAAKPEYETACAFGSMNLDDNLQSIIMSNDICNRYGLDTISTGATIAFAMECYQNQIISKSDTDGIELNWGNHKAIVDMTEKIAKREGFGAILADGSKIAAEKIGKGAGQYAMHVHGQEFPSGGDPIDAPSFSTTYVTSATPAHHMEGGAEWVEIAGPPNGVEFPQIEKHQYSGKGQIHAWMRKYSRMMDAAGFCNLGGLIFNLPVNVVPEQMTAVTGWDYSLEEVLKVGERIACLCQAFNVREGLKPSDFTLPGRVIGQPPFSEGAKANITIDVTNMTKEFFEAMDWDIMTGKPSKKKLIELGFDKVAQQLWPSD